ncbi:hypothetical protein BKA62DRAFT_810189 [Auriculariales sp. MPI-PUGE-AT-0066]|nr:hypothetical protein BKA62DRAFT_810189 [Auriculariales sp. MPI-PUGE-AT-0066]
MSSFKCPMPSCYKVFTRSQHVIRHMESEHIKCCWYPCPFCRETFRQKAKAKIHAMACEKRRGRLVPVITLESNALASILRRYWKLAVKPPPQYNGRTAQIRSGDDWPSHMASTSPPKLQLQTQRNEISHATITKPLSPSRSIPILLPPVPDQYSFEAVQMPQEVMSPVISDAVFETALQSYQPDSSSTSNQMGHILPPLHLHPSYNTRFKVPSHTRNNWCSPRSPVHPTAPPAAQQIIAHDRRSFDAAADDPTKQGSSGHQTPRTQRNEGMWSQFVKLVDSLKVLSVSKLVERGIGPRTLSKTHNDSPTLDPPLFPGEPEPQIYFNWEETEQRLPCLESVRPTQLSNADSSTSSVHPSARKNTGALEPRSVKLTTPVRRQSGLYGFGLVDWLTKKSSNKTRNSSIRHHPYATPSRRTRRASTNLGPPLTPHSFAIADNIRPIATTVATAPRAAGVREFIPRPVLLPLGAVEVGIRAWEVAPQVVRLWAAPDQPPFDIACTQPVPTAREDSGLLLPRTRNETIEGWRQITRVASTAPLVTGIGTRDEVDWRVFRQSMPNVYNALSNQNSLPQHVLAYEMEWEGQQGQPSVQSPPVRLSELSFRS